MIEPVVAVSAYGRSAASTRVRMHDWLEHTGIAFQAHGYLGRASNPASAMLRNLPGVMAAEMRLRRLEREVPGRTVLLGRAASPFSNGRLEAGLLSRAGLGVYDFDDALFNDVDGLSRRLWSKARVWRAAVEAADVVIAGSEYLADAATQVREDVVMIPSCVEPGDYVAKTDFELGDSPRAVWIGSPSTERLLLDISRPLLEMHTRFGLRLTVISGAPRALGALDPMVDRHPWTEDTYPELVAAADFGIMPLPDTPFTRGKCAYKLLQYAASALPLIGSPVGANRRALATLGGFAASTDEEWHSAMETLLDMSARGRESRGRAAREAVDREYSFDAWESTWRAALGKT